MNKNLKAAIGIILLTATVFSFGLTGCRSEGSKRSKRSNSISEAAVEDHNVLSFTVTPMIGSKISYMVNTNGNVEVSAPDYAELSAEGESGQQSYKNYTAKLSSSDLNEILRFVDDYSEENDFYDYATDGGDYYFEITSFDGKGNEYKIFSAYQYDCKEINAIHEILSGYLLD